MAEVGSAFVSVVPSARGFGRKLEKDVGKDTKSSGKRIGSALGRAVGVGVAVTAAFGFVKGALAEGREAQKVGALTNAVLKSTGGVANVTAKQVDTLASSLSKKIGVDDEAIAAGENMLLTFTNVRNEVGKGNDIFNQATTSAQDLAAAFGGDAVSNSKLLGKALNDPVKGVSALTRVGVSFTQGQKDQIKALQATGDVLGAQKIILGEVTKQTKGAALSQVTNADKARVAFGNLQESIGTALLPVIDRLAGIFANKVAPAVSTFVGQMRSGQGAGGQFASVLGTLGSVLGTVFGFISSNKAAVGAFAGVILTVVAALRIWAAVQTVLNVVLTANPIGIVVVAIAALVAGIVLAYKHSETFRRIADAAFRGIAAAATFMWNGVVQPILRFMIQAFGKVAGVYAKVLGALSKVPGFGWLKPVAKGLQRVSDGAKDVADKVRKIPTSHNTKITADTGAAKSAVASFIAGIDKDVTIKVHANIAGAAAAIAGVGRNAAGTDFWRGGPTWVGERGPEIVNLPRGARVTPNNEIRAGGGGGVTILRVGDREFRAYAEEIADSRVGAHARMGRESARAARR